MAITKADLMPFLVVPVVRGGFSGLGKASHWWSFERINDGGRMLINTTVLSPSVAEVQDKTRQRSSGCYTRFVKD